MLVAHFAHRDPSVNRDSHGRTALSFGSILMVTQPPFNRGIAAREASVQEAFPRKSSKTRDSATDVVPEMGQR